MYTASQTLETSVDTANMHRRGRGRGEGGVLGLGLGLGLLLVLGGGLGLVFLVHLGFTVSGGVRSRFWLGPST